MTDITRRTIRMIMGVVCAGTAGSGQGLLQQQEILGKYWIIIVITFVTLAALSLSASLSEPPTSKG